MQTNEIDVIVNPTGPSVTQVGQWLDSAGNYYEGDRQPNSTAVPQRPSLAHDWNGTAWVQSTSKAALSTIAALESQQAQRLTPRAMREFILGVMAATGYTGAPAFAALKAIDDQIKAERAKL